MKYKINAKLVAIEDKKVITLPTSDGQEKKYLEYARAEFELDGMVNQLLQAMKETHSEDGGYQKTFSQSGASMKKDILETFWRRSS